MVKNYSDSERGNPLPPYPHGLIFPIGSKVFYMHHPTDGMTPLLHQSWSIGWNEKGHK